MHPASKEEDRLPTVAWRNQTSPWAVLSALLIGTLVGTLGNSVSNVALPAIMAHFQVPLSSTVWVVTLYVVTFAVLMPVCGYLGDLFGQRRLYLWGMGLFTLAQLASGLAPSFAWLLGSRLLLGIGIAPTLPAVMALITRTFAPGERGRAMGLWALVNGAAHALGPPLSGFLTQHAGWRSVFLVSLPLCFLNLILVAWRVPPDGKQRAPRFDLPGAAALTVTALGLMLALTQSTRWGWLSPGALGLWGLTAAGLLAFVAAERRASAPFVDLSLLADRRYAAAVVVISAQFFCLFGLLLALPVFLIDGLGWSDGLAGLLVLPLPLTMALAAPLAGRLADARGSRWTCTLGMSLVVTAGLALYAWTALPVQQAAPPWWALAGSLVLMGAGMGLTQSPVTAAVTHIVPAAQVGVATGIFHMGRFVSGSLGSTVFGLLMETDAAGMAAGLGRNLLLLAAAAAVAIVAALQLPGTRAQRSGRQRHG
jgi:EmrB/QacA subfamily drug resistance transporter